MTVVSDRLDGRPEAGPPREALDSDRIVSWTGQLAIGLCLVLAYFLVSLAASPEAHWLTDVGGKTATVEAMVERGDWSTDIGYWAESADPDGAMHPFRHTQQMANGWWVNTTSVLMVFAARPLWQLGGPQLALVLPMLGAAATALAAGAMERRMVGGSGLRSTVVVGLATPVALYALDFWEHSIALACMVGAINLVLGVLDPDSDASEPRRLQALAACGVLFGLASVMRQEAMVYGFVAGLTMVGATLRLRPSLSLLRAPAMAGSTVVVLALNEVFERWYYGGSLRAARSGSAATQVGSSLIPRLEAAIVTAAAPLPEFTPTNYLFAAALIGLIGWFTASAMSGAALRIPGAALLAAVLFLVLRFAALGPTFVPGLVASTPLVVAGVVVGFRTRRTIPLVLALVPLPLIFATQYLGGILPQWGGRYLLLTGTILTAVACAELPRVNRDAFAALALGGLCVTGLGAYWYAERTTELADTWHVIETLSSDGEDVVVWYDPVYARESGAELIGSRWLSTFGRREYGAIDSVLTEMAVDRFVWLSPEGEVDHDFAGFEMVESHGRIDSILGIHAATYVRLN